MVESSWSDSQSSLTTELGSALDPTDTPWRRCVVPKVRPRQRDGSDDQQVPEYWDQRVPVWSCKEARDRTKRKLKGATQSVGMFNSTPGDSEAMLVVQQWLEET